MKLSLLVVNYNTESYIAELLHDLTLQTLDKQSFEVILVNNVQNQRLQNMLDEFDFAKKLNISLIPSSKNVGFGRAMNFGASFAKGEHLLITNPDIRISTTTLLQDLLQHTVSHHDYGIMTCKILDDQQHDQSTAYDYEFNQSLEFKNEICWFQGSFLLIKASTFQRLHGFDPDFFMYCEDSDLCYRAKKLGLSLIKLEDAFVYHKGGSSEPNRDYAFYHRWYLSRFLFAKKHFPTALYQTTLNELEQKAQQKLKREQWLKPFRALFSKKQPALRWQVTLDIIQKIKIEGEDWLYYKG